MGWEEEDLTGGIAKIAETGRMVLLGERVLIDRAVVVSLPFRPRVCGGLEPRATLRLPWA